VKFSVSNLTLHIHPSVIQFFEDLFDGLIIEPILAEHPTDLFYHKNGITYMRQDSKYGVLKCKYSGYWGVLHDKIGIKYSDIQTVIQTMVSEHTKRKVEAPKLMALCKSVMVSEHTKRKVEAPIPLNPSLCD
jgi:hypothetical protein